MSIINMKKTIVSLLSLLFFILVIDASPVFQKKFTVLQSDGSLLSVTRVGSDHLLYYVTDDGIPVFPNSDNTYCYAEFDDCNNVIASNVVAHEESRRTPVEQNFAKTISSDFYTSVSMQRMTRYGVGKLSSASVKSHGDVHVAVILAEFQDLSFKEENDINRFSQHFNASNYTEEGGAGSVRDYFISQSDSIFRPYFDIVAKVKVSQDYSYYGKNSGGDDIRGRTYITEAVDSAVKRGVDFSKYLNDNGELFVIVIYPGHGEQVSGSSESLWATYYFSMSHTAGSYKLTAGLVMDELADYGRGEMFDGIGTLCHEFSHAIGLPDFYNTTSARNIFGMDVWSIMDYGQYNNLSRTPTGYTSYEREFMGWLKVDTLKDVKQKVKIAPLSSCGSNRAYRIINPSDNSGNEYYLLENRQISPWYLKIYGEGMLVLHVDYNANSWSSNTINNSLTHQRMTIIPADNSLVKISSKASDYKGDLFPGLMNTTEFSSTTTPSTKVYNGGVMDIKLKDIHEENDTIVFYYQCDGQLNSPSKISVVGETENGVMLSVDSVSNAERYLVKVVYDGMEVFNKTVTNTDVVIPNLVPDKSYTISVLALADDYLDSEPVQLVYSTSLYSKTDVNRDGETNSADAVAVYNYIISGVSSGLSLERADTNSDGNVDSSDIIEIYNRIIGK